MNRLLPAAMAVALTAILAGCGTTREAPRTASARIEYVAGEVQVDGAPVETGAVLSPIFRVATGPASTVSIVFDERNILVVEEETVAYIDLTADVRTVELRRGALASTLRKLGQVSSRESDRFRVKTPSAVAGVRGTVFYARVEDPTHTYLCTCNGTLHLTDADGANPFTSVAAHHEAFRFTREADGGVTVQPAEMAHHGDGDMEAAAARIGETIDWNSVEGR